ncbi:unnamed protein product [Oppiella nova]|uniref:Uncharacterized protein n=1 Tax=Oppiella nova TaxID=334625 RepID=A0A7R9QDR0_9ACAR|nr:unnamed protein product [Oppiella nova]CAG2163746.1 unnamed protein product [Oppiella nova]
MEFCSNIHDKRIHYKTSRKHTADIGDLKYHASEIGEGKKYGHKSDIYSLALIGGEIFDVDLFSTTVFNSSASYSSKLVGTSVTNSIGLNDDPQVA